MLPMLLVVLLVDVTDTEGCGQERHHPIEDQNETETSNYKITSQNNNIFSCKAFSVFVNIVNCNFVLL